MGSTPIWKLPNHVKVASFISTDWAFMSPSVKPLASAAAARVNMNGLIFNTPTETPFITPIKVQVIKTAIILKNTTATEFKNYRSYCTAKSHICAY